jgi:NADPH:quinone reductase-like Zn-dependent oxidoreductase
MLAAQITTLGDEPSVAEVDEPTPSAAETVVQLEAVALNPLDLSVGAGRFYGGHPPLPYAPGCEAVGRTADGVRVYLFGDARGVSKPGFAAERVAVPRELPLRVPDGIASAVAAAIGIAGIAAWVPVAWRAELRPDDRVLVLGASGTVGRLAVQAAKVLGAAKVVGASRSGAAGTIRLDEIPAAFEGDGFTVCIDPLWGEPLAAALGAAAQHARVIHVGQSAGAESPLRSADVRGKELVVRGHSNFAMTAEERGRAYLELFGLVAAGRIAVELETFSLDRVADAWRHQAGGGKAVVTLG